MSNRKPLEDRVALVTGASRGIGAALAKGLAGAGAHVVLVARTLGGLEETYDAIVADGGTATVSPFNLLDLDKINDIGPLIYDRFKRLDILVGNAAMLGEITPLHQIDAKVWDRVIALNLTANQRLIATLDPLLRASDAGRAIFVTSGAAKHPGAFWGAYAASKAGLDAMIQSYAAETQKTNMKINLLDPGIVRTAMRAQAFPGEDPDTLADPESLVPACLELADPACKKHGEIMHG